MQTLLAIICLSLPILVTGFIAFSAPLQRAYLRLVLAFSAAYLFSISIIHMLPEAFGESDHRTAGLFIVIGMSTVLLVLLPLQLIMTMIRKKSGSHVLESVLLLFTGWSLLLGSLCLLGRALSGGLSSRLGSCNRSGMPSSIFVGL